MLLRKEQQLLSSMKLLLTLLLVLLAAWNCDGTLSKSDKKNKKEQQPLKTVSGPLQESVRTRGLVSSTVKWSDVVGQHAGYQALKLSTLAASDDAPAGARLAYVTPWNNHGYDIAKLQAGRFSHVSPVWLQLKPQQQGWVVTGLQDVDQGWVADVRGGAQKLGRTTKLVPRIIFEGWSAAHFQSLVDSSKQRQLLGRDLLKLVKDHQFDGLVLEVWSQLPARALLSTMPAVVADVAAVVRESGYTVIVVIPPAVYHGKSSGVFQASHFRALAPHVDYFSLMTYDYSSLQNPGPNSPLSWMEECVLRLEPDQDSPNRAKILLGLNMYGLDHSSTGGRHLLGRDYVAILSQHKPKMLYDDDAVEHFFEYRSDGRRTVFYPSLYSLHMRVSLAARLNTGLSLWEVGQGLDYFYDLL